MKIAVVGAGGLGGYFGGRLAVAGENVHFLARGAQLEALLGGGLSVESVLGDFALGPEAIPASQDPAAIGPADVVLFTVKSYDTDSAAAAIAPLIGAGTVVISLQNGIDNEEKLASRLGAEHVAGGAAYIFAGIKAPGVIRHTGGPARLIFGELDGHRSDRLDSFLRSCLAAGIAAEVSDDIRVTLWTKYAFICAQAGLTAATRSPIGVIRDTPATWALFGQVLGEAAATGRAEGVDLPADFVERGLALAATLGPGLYSSLYDDLVTGRRIELDALLGELVRRAGAAGVPAPAASALYGIILAQPPSLHSD
ncbi:MAG TPA: 2-dehydropantoate 2-reductase [Candidatus Dormibacteraeota bacterium]|nr:2-dehydropantoate 2-reductase [Candidatus Dormibacteraeota bacterium]